jgi:murein DD-endopeptidase MepM/ murein hydrolase activator NlpD
MDLFRFIAALGVTAVFAAADPLAAQTAAPGSLVHWPGEGIERCLAGNRSFAPTMVGGEPGCLVPVGLTRTADVIAERDRDGRREKLHIGLGEYPYSVQRLEIKDRSRVDLSPENLARVQRENALIGKLWGRQGKPRFSLPLGPPLEEMPAGGRFGAKRIINGEPRSPHTGADYAVPQGTPVLAVENAVVALAEEFFFSGNAVFLDHGNGLISMYFHLHEVYVEQGDEVARGRLIGTVGSTGRSTGPHLHFGIRWQGERVDPALLVGEPGSIATVR